MNQVVSADGYVLLYVRKDLKSFLRQTFRFPEQWPFNLIDTKRKNNIIKSSDDPDKSLLSRRLSRGSKRNGVGSSRPVSQYSMMSES